MLKSSTVEDKKFEKSVDISSQNSDNEKVKTIFNNEAKSTVFKNSTTLVNKKFQQNVETFLQTPSNTQQVADTPALLKKRKRGKSSKSCRARSFSKSKAVRKALKTSEYSKACDRKVLDPIIHKLDHLLIKRLPIKELITKISGILKLSAEDYMEIKLRAMTI